MLQQISFLLAGTALQATLSCDGASNTSITLRHLTSSSCLALSVVFVLVMPDKISDLFFYNIVVCFLLVASPSHNSPSLIFPPLNTVKRNLIRVAASWAGGVWTFTNQEGSFCNEYIVTVCALKLEVWLWFKLPQTIICAPEMTRNSAAGAANIALSIIVLPITAFFPLSVVPSILLVKPIGVGV